MELNAKIMKKPRKIVSQYKFGIEYWYTKWIDIPQVSGCQYCVSGKHTRVGDGKVVTCPVCDGASSIQAGSTTVFKPDRCYLRNIEYIYDPDTGEIDTEYTFRDVNDVLIRDTIYDTLEQCELNAPKFITGTCSLNNHRRS